MTDKSREYFQRVKERIKQEDIPKIEEELGVQVSCGVGSLEATLAIILRLQSLGKDAEPLSQDRREQLEKDLTAKYDVPVRAVYLSKGFKKREQ
ncbi:MAG: hypothetical protein AABX31_03495 [Nanoarchaeota archaeon]